MLYEIVTGKINNLAVSVNESLGTRTNVGTLIFVDDTFGTGSKANIEIHEIEQIKCYRKSTLKKLVKNEMLQYVNKEYQQESKSMKK